MSSRATSLSFVRQAVPKDNDCLFSAIAYITAQLPVTRNKDDSSSSSPSTAASLRKKCADVIANDPETYDILRLGMDNPAYCTWIQNKFNWGGENEILIFTSLFNIEIAIVSYESLTCLVYGADRDTSKLRVYLLYTGQHYDVLCMRSDDSSEEKVGFPVGDTVSEKAALEFAKACKEEDDRKARQKTKKVIKCGGCDALLDDNQAFQEHCMTVEHDDEFCYDCQEVEVVVPEDEITLDLNSPDVLSFIQMETAPFAPNYPAPFTINGQPYKTFERYFQAVKFESSDEETANAIRTTSNDNDALMLASSGTSRPDWEQRKAEFAKQGLREQYAQNQSLKERLLATGSKTLVFVGNDRWAGMCATGGVPVGRNVYGNLLMEVRKELAEEK